MSYLLYRREETGDNEEDDGTGSRKPELVWSSIESDRNKTKARLKSENL